MKRTHLVGSLVFLLILAVCFSFAQDRSHRGRHRLDERYLPVRLRHMFGARGIEPAPRGQHDASYRIHDRRAWREQRLAERLKRNARHRLSETRKSLPSNKGGLLPVSSVTQCPDSAKLAWSAKLAAGGFVSEEQATALVTDQAGNVYVTGMKDSLETGMDMITVKYNASGQQMWVAIYNGPGNDDDGGIDIGVDGSGNVYVTGYSFGTASFLDYTTIKYNASGSQVWVAHYDGPGIDDDVPVAMAVDLAENVYVTGASYGVESGLDFTTIKYFPSGGEAWVKRYDGPAIDDDWATDLAIDAGGNVYVTGTSLDIDNYFDYTTIKYFSSGSQDWAVRYDGPEFDEDVATSVGVDGSGNVYVTGFSSSVAVFVVYDYATVKYNSAGVQQWANRYNGPGDDDDIATDITVDGAGNVYVTGYSFGLSTFDDFATLKYTPGGVLAWEARYNGDANDDDAATAIGIDTSGSVFVTGYSFNPASSYDYTTVKYSPAGVRQWAIQHNGTANDDDEATDLSVDHAGNVYVSGASTTLTGDFDYMTVKYLTRLPCMELSQNSIVFDSVHVSCRLLDTIIVQNTGPVTLDLSVAVTEPSFTVSPSLLSVGSLGSASVVVAFTPLGTGAKSGALIFTHNGLGSPDSVPVFGSGFVGPSGIVVHSGSGVGWQLISLPVSTPCPFIFPGAFQFVYQRGYVRVDTLANGPGYWKKLAAPDLTFTGYSINADTIPLTPGWNMIGTISQPVDTGAVATVPAGILITGFYGFTGSGYGIEDTLFPGRGYWVKSTQHGQLILDALVAPRPDGTLRDWLAASSRVTITDAGGNSQSLYFMKSTEPGFVAEYFELPPVPPSGIFDARFASGRILEVLESGRSGRLPIVVLSAEYPLSIQWEPMPDNDNAQIVVGSRTLPMNAGGRIEVVDPQLRITLERGGGVQIPREFSLGQNHPNPFNPTTRIVYGVKNPEFIELKVYDVLGREVSTLVNERKAPGTYVAAFSASGLSSGLYFYKIRAGSFVAVRKMIVLK